jgi:hypothetical protein
MGGHESRHTPAHTSQAKMRASKASGKLIVSLNPTP